LPHLHAHHLVHVRRENDDIIARFADGETFHARPAVPRDARYITKQRRWLAPASEREIRRPWQSNGGSVPGKRWTATGGALALVARQRVKRVTSRALEAAPPATVEVQLSLFGYLPVQPPDPFGTGSVVRLAREQGGLSQADLAARLGLRDRSHVANVERGHVRLSLSRRRLLCRIIETDRLAA